MFEEISQNLTFATDLGQLITYLYTWGRSIPKNAKKKYLSV